VEEKEPKSNFFNVFPASKRPPGSPYYARAVLANEEEFWVPGIDKYQIAAEKTVTFISLLQQNQNCPLCT
jgi:hypothetical protein